MPQIQTGYLLVASIIAAVMGVSTFATLRPNDRPIDISISPEKATYTLGETFEVFVIVRSNEPVNVFSGTMSFNPDVLSVASIDYNTSIADLWAVEPWYANGDGTIGFAGGTTKAGGFAGEDTLLKITFTAQDIGNASLHLFEERILRHDGLGTYVALTASPIDALFTIEPNQLEEDTLAKEDGEKSSITVLTSSNAADLNSDGIYSFKDISVFMVHMSKQNLRSDLNGDSIVSIADLSILLEVI